MRDRLQVLGFILTAWSRGAWGFFRHRFFHPVLSFALGLLMGTPDVGAQLSLKPQPLPQSTTFLVSEMGIHWRLTPSPRETVTSYHPVFEKKQMRRDRRLYALSEIGIMRNIHRHWAVGITHVVGADLFQGAFRGGFNGRVKRWMRGGNSVEVSAGVVLWDTGRNFDMPGFQMSISLQIRNWLRPGLLMEYAGGFRDERNLSRDPQTGALTGNLQQTEADKGVYLGTMIGSYPGLVANSIAMISAIIVYIAWMTTPD